MTEQASAKLKVSALSPTKLAIEVADVGEIERVRAIPQREYKSRYRHWEVPAIDSNIAYINATWKPDDLDCTEEARLILRYIELRAKKAARKEKRRWEYVFEGDVPEISYVPHTPKYKHQIVALDAVHNEEFFGLFMEMGTGKTVVVLDEIRWIRQDRDRDEDTKPLMILIVAPAGVTHNWINEMKKHWPADFDWQAWNLNLGFGGTDQMIEMARSKASVKALIVSFDRVSIFQEFLCKFKFDLMVVDESARIKNPYAKRSKAVHEVAQAAAMRRLALTGSPILNNILDVFSQFHYMSPGCLGFDNFNAFQNHYAEMAQGKGKKSRKIEGFRYVDELKERMARYSFVVKKVDCLDLPEKRYETRPVIMGEKQRSMYNQMLEWFIASLNDVPTGADDTTEARAAIAQLTRLRQICAGFINTATGEKEIPDATGKMDQLIDDLEDIDGKVLIWREFRYDDHFIEKALTRAGKKWVKIVGGMRQEDRIAAERLFNTDDSIDALIGAPQSAGEGLTLLGTETRPCSDVVYWTNSFALGPRIQSEDRCHRIGQRNVVIYRDYVCEDSIEERVALCLQMKKDLANEVTNVKNIKEILLGDLSLVKAFAGVA